MKKILALVAAALSTAAVFAENTLHIGVGFPISPLKADNQDYDWVSTQDFSETGVDFAFDYTHVADSGFAFKVGFDVGYVSSSDMKTYKVDASTFSFKEEDDAAGLDLAFGVGFGGSPIHDEKMTLSIFGTFGFRYQLFDILSASFSGNSLDVTWSNYLFYIGPEVAYTFRFNEHVGLFADFGIFYNIGAGGYAYEYSGSGSISESIKETYHLDDLWLVSGFTFQPKIGLAITF